ncbi:hypothetical protein D3C71_956980 [compost metagenome]
MENLVAFNVGNLLRMKAQKSAPKIPKTIASTKEVMNWEIKILTEKSPETIKPRIASGIAKVNTSVSADSIMSVVDVLGCTSTFFTKPTTTAEDVPPKADPINKLLTHER